MKIAIIGAGISGLIARGAFSSSYDNEIRVFDKRPKEKLPLSDHKAVMRLRDDRIKNYVNCQLKKVDVYKAVYHNGEIYDKPNILLNNLYSIKAYGTLGDRSLSSLGRVERYLLKSFGPDCQDYEIRDVIDIMMVKHGTLYFKDGNGYEYDVCISTIPMPILIKMLGIESTADFSYSPIHIIRGKIKIKSNVHQTIYFTDKESSHPYRATIEGDTIIAESIDYPDEEGFTRCLTAFGLSIYDIEEGYVRYLQKIGKINEIDDYERRRLMMQITKDHNIYSFGRFATWRPLRIDQTFDDIEKIKLFIKLTSQKYYDL